MTLPKLFTQGAVYVKNSDYMDSDPVKCDSWHFGIPFKFKQTLY